MDVGVATPRQTKKQSEYGRNFTRERKVEVIGAQDLDDISRVPLSHKNKDSISLENKSRKLDATRNSVPYFRRLQPTGKENLPLGSFHPPPSIHHISRPLDFRRNLASNSSHESPTSADYVGDPHPTDVQHVHRLHHGGLDHGNDSPTSQHSTSPSEFIPATGSTSSGYDGNVSDSVCDGMANESSQRGVPFSNSERS